MQGLGGLSGASPLLPVGSDGEDKGGTVASDHESVYDLGQLAWMGCRADSEYCIA